MVALVIGASLGVCLSYSAHVGLSLVSPDDPAKSLAIVVTSTSIRFALAAAVLAAVFYVAPAALLPFSAGLLLGVLAVANVALVRHAGLRRLLRKVGW